MSSHLLLPIQNVFLEKKHVGIGSKRDETPPLLWTMSQSRPAWISFFLLLSTCITSRKRQKSSLNPYNFFDYSHRDESSASKQAQRVILCKMTKIYRAWLLVSNRSTVCLLISIHKNNLNEMPRFIIAQTKLTELFLFGLFLLYVSSILDLKYSSILDLKIKI